MRCFIVFTVALIGCSSITAKSIEKPSGEEAIYFLLKNTDLLLKNEPLCDVVSVSMGVNELSLGQHLSTNLSVSHESNNLVNIASSCSRSKHELKSKSVIDVWDCKFEVLENDGDGGFISSSMIAYSVDLNKTKLIPGSLRCF